MSQVGTVREIVCAEDQFVSAHSAVDIPILGDVAASIT